MKGFKFEVVDDKFRKNFDRLQDMRTKKTMQFPMDITLPIRKTSGSAGYDFILPYDVDFIAGKTTVVVTDIKCLIPKGFFLDARIRSSLGIKYGLQLANAPGTIDEDYYNNTDTGGNIMIAIVNNTGTTYKAKKGEAIIQGILLPYQVTEDDEVTAERTGGVGSTGK